MRTAKQKHIKMALQSAALGTVVFLVAGCVVEPYPPPAPVAVAPAPAPAYYGGPYSYYEYPPYYPYYYGPEVGVGFAFGGHDHWGHGGHWR